MQDLLKRIAAHVRPMAAQGRVANYIPSLITVDPTKFGIAIATLDGDVFATGDSDQPFSIQSVSKVFALTLALRLTDNKLWERVGRLPS